MRLLDLYFCAMRGLYMAGYRWGGPAIHRGRPPSPEQSPARGTAHGATNLFRRGRYTLLEGIAEGHLAHGELQERKVMLTLPS